MDQQPEPRAQDAPIVPVPNVSTTGSTAFDATFTAGLPSQVPPNGLPGAVQQPQGEIAPAPPQHYYQPQPIYITQQVQMVPVQIGVMQPKSVGVALLLTFFFGPLGLFYSSVVGGIVMLIVTIFAAAFTFGVSVLVTWPICMIWGAVAASNANSRVAAGAGVPTQIVR